MGCAGVLRGCLCEGLGEKSPRSAAGEGGSGQATGKEVGASAGVRP